MDHKKTGTIRKEPDGYTVQFERSFPYDTMTVWDAITNPRKMLIWFLDVEMDLKVGNRMAIRFHDEDDTVTYGRITAVEPGKLFEYIWENTDLPDELTRWELFPEGPAHCRLILTHSRIDERFKVSVPTGWHIMLDHLEAVLNGRTEPFPEEKSPQEQAIKKIYEDSSQQPG